MKNQAVSRDVTDFYNSEWKDHDYFFTLAFKDAIYYSYRLLGNVQGRKILEIGAGRGEQAVYLASLGAEVYVIDISKQSLQEVERCAKNKHLQVTCALMNAEKMNYLEDEFDLVYINSVLMHTNHLLVLRECSRVLKAGGKLIVIEPLQHTLFLQGYRLFSHYRLTKPQYMTFRKFKDGASFFTSYNHTEFYFFACLFLPVFYLRIKWLYAFFFLAAKVDKILLLLFPFLKFGAWVSVAEFRK